MYLNVFSFRTFLSPFMFAFVFMRVGECMGMGASLGACVCGWCAHVCVCLRAHVYTCAGGHVRACWFIYVPLCVFLVFLGEGKFGTVSAITTLLFLFRLRVYFFSPEITR